MSGGKVKQFTTWYAEWKWAGGWRGVVLAVVLSTLLAFLLGWFPPKAWGMCDGGTTANPCWTPAEQVQRFNDGVLGRNKADARYYPYQKTRIIDAIQTYQRNHLSLFPEGIWTDRHAWDVYTQSDLCVAAGAPQMVVSCKPNDAFQAHVDPDYALPDEPDKFRTWRIHVAICGGGVLLALVPAIDTVYGLGMGGLNCFWHYADATD